MKKSFHLYISMPVGSMYCIFTYIYHQNQLNVANYTMHGSYGMDMSYMSDLATPRHVSMSGRLQHQDSGGEVSNIFHVKEK